MIRTAILAALLVLPSMAQAACGPDALGTARTLTLKREAAAYGTAQHAALPLAKGEVVITFDDGPRPATTPDVLETLKAQCVKATFFMNGDLIAASPGLARRVAAEGHAVGLHGYKHAHFGELPEAEQLGDLKAVVDIGEATFGAQLSPVYRFPFLEETDPLRGDLARRGYTVMSIDVAIDDWLPDQSPKMLTERLMQRLEKSGGGIILMHDWQPQTATALPELLKALKDKGYTVVHLAWE